MIFSILLFGTFSLAAQNANVLTSGTLNNARLPGTISGTKLFKQLSCIKGDGSSNAL